MFRPVSDPAWHGAVLWYLYLGGIASGSALVAALATRLGIDPNRRLLRVSSLVAIPLAVACLALVPESTGRPPIPLVSFAALALAIAMSDASRPRRLLTLAYAASALGLAASLGWVFPSTWTSRPWLVALALVGTIPAGVSALVLATHRREANAGLGRLNALAVVVQLAILIGLSLTLRGDAGLAFMQYPGKLIPLFVVPLGLVLPLILGEARGERGEADVACLVLLGGFVLDFALTGIHTQPSHP